MKELCLKKFIEKQRVMSLVILSLLPNHTKHFAFKISQLLISDDDEQSHKIDRERKHKQKFDQKSLYYERMTQKLFSSKEEVDKNLLHLHKISMQDKTDLFDYLGIKAAFANRFLKPLE